MGGAVLFVITLASAVTGAIYQFLLLPLNITYLQTIVFILPKEVYKEGIYPSNSSSIIVTKEAITTIKAGILTLSGMTLRRNESRYR